MRVNDHIVMHNEKDLVLTGLAERMGLSEVMIIEQLRKLSSFFSDMCRNGERNGQLDMGVGNLTIESSLIRFYPNNSQTK